MTLRDCSSVGAATSGNTGVTPESRSSRLRQLRRLSDHETSRSSWQPARWYPLAETVVTGVAVVCLARSRRWRAVTTVAASWTGGRLATTGIGARPWSGGGVAYGLGRVAPPWRIPLLAMSGVAELLRRDDSARGLGPNAIGWIAGVAGAGAAVRVAERASDRRRQLSSRRQVAVVVNADSGSPHLARRAVATMRRQPVDIVSLETTTGADLLTSLERALKSLEPEGILAVAGGDGTVGCAAARAAEVGRTLAILPTGTGNDIARSLGLPLNPEEAVDLIAETDPSPMDLVATENGIFADAASVGMIADFATRVRDTHGWRRPFVYPVKAWQAWREHKLLDVDVVIDGHPVFLSGLPYQVAVYQCSTSRWADRLHASRRQA